MDTITITVPITIRMSAAIVVLVLALLVLLSAAGLFYYILLRDFRERAYLSGRGVRRRSRKRRRRRYFSVNLAGPEGYRPLSDIPR